MEKIWFKWWPKGLPHELDVPTRPLHAFLTERAGSHPEKTAINYYGRKISFRELDDLSDRLAAALADMGVGRGDRVSIFLENCPQFVIAYFATLKAGGVVVAANPMFKEEELRYELQDCGAKVVIALDHLYPMVRSVREYVPLEHAVVTSYRDFLPESPSLPLHPSMERPKETFPDTVELVDLFDRYEPRPPDVRLDMHEDLALLQYTSGTTGMPKGAMISHYSLLHNVIGSALWNGIDQDDVHLSVLPFFHVTGMIHSMDMPVYTGTTNVMLSRFETTTAMKAIAELGCTTWVSITTMNVAVINDPEVDSYDLSSLRHCLSGGAPIPEEILRKWKEKVGPELIEGYGLSETISQTHVNPPERPKYGSVGIPHFGVDCRIVDLEGGRQLAAGQEGELLIKGPMVTKGYWNKPEATREVLMDGWLATGDIARMDDEGYFYIVGRKKELIKASGYSVFPAEVEALMYQHPAIKEVAVIGVPDPYRGEDIKAFVVLRPEFRGRVTEDEIISWARKKMAAYKYPRMVEFVEDFPRTGSGKILKRVLAEMEKGKRSG